MFSNREEAGRLLGVKVAAALGRMHEEMPHDTIVVGLPRGGVPVAKEVALALGAPLTILVAKKIGAPFQPELALGAVSSGGIVVLNNDLQHLVDRMPTYIRSQRERLADLTKTLERHWLQLAGVRGPASFAGKRVIVVDDGIATGMTVLAALRSIRAQRPHELILATPVVSPEIKLRLERECDKLIAILTPNDLSAIGYFYQDFEQVEEPEMLKSLTEANEAFQSWLQRKAAAAGS